MTIFDHTIDFLFFMDVIFNFRTTYINQKTGSEVVNPRTIAITYAFKGRFAIDMLASIPFEVVFGFFTMDSGGITKALGLLKLVRLLRLGRIITYMKFKQEFKVGMRIFQLLFFLLLLVHWIACLWFMLVQNRDSWMPPKDQNNGYTDFYDISNLDQYTVVFYYAILLIVGNESAPISAAQTLFSSLIVMIGAISTAFIFGNMAALMAVINKKDSRFQEQIDFVSTTMRSIKLPESIQNQVIEYLMHCQESPDIQQDIDKFFEALSPSLKNIVLIHMFNKVIKSIEIFKDCTEIETGFIINNLKSMLFLIDDEIIRQGDFGNRMYFISSGMVDVYLTVEKYHHEIKNPDKDPNEPKNKENIKENALLKHETRINRMISGSYFGEIALITNLKRTATVKSVDYTTVSYLTRSTFEDIQKEFPQVYLNFKNNIKNYSDTDFEFRRSMVKNTPYFRHLNSEIIDEIVYLLRPNRYDPNTIIIKYGDITDKIYYLKQGEIDVTIPVKTGMTLSETHFETLNEGSCFCAFSAFSEETQQLVNFKAKSSCIVETIAVKDLDFVERTYLQLSDEIKKLKLLIDNKDKSELDFFRYLRPLRKQLQESVKKQIRLKFKNAVQKFVSRYKQNADSLPSALVALQDIMKERRRKQKEILHLQRINTIKYLQEKSPLANPSQDQNISGMNMFMNDSFKNQIVGFNFDIQPSPNLGLNTPMQPKLENFNNLRSFNQKTFDKGQDDLDLIKRLEEVARKEKAKTNQNLSKLLSLVETHNGNLEDIETKLKKEFIDIKENMRKIKVFQKENEQKIQESIKVRLEQKQSQLEDAQIQNNAILNSLNYDESRPKVKSPVKGDRVSNALLQANSNSQNIESKLQKSGDVSKKRPQELDLNFNKIQQLYPQAEELISPNNLKGEGIEDAVFHNEKKLEDKTKINQFSNSRGKEPNSTLIPQSKVNDKGDYKNKSLKAPRNKTSDKNNRFNSPADSKNTGLFGEKERKEETKNKLNISPHQNSGEKEIELTDEEEFEKEIKKISSRDKSASKEPSQDQINALPSFKNEEQKFKGFDDENKRFEEKEKRIDYLDDSSSDNQDDNSNEDFDDLEDNNDEDDKSDNENINNVKYEENMPRLEEDLDDVKMKQRKKKRKMKSKGLLNENQQDFNDIIRDQIKKHDKTQNQKDSNKAKKSYHAYLEHPRMKHQTTRQSPRSRDKNNNGDQGEFTLRPKKK